MPSRVLLSGLAVGIWGCGFQLSESSATPSLVDSGVNDASSACTTFSSLVDTCEPGLDFTKDFTFSGNASYDTDHVTFNGQPVDGNTLTRRPMTIAGVEVEVIFAHNVSIESGGLRVTGSKPLALIASGTILFDFGVKIDVGSGGAGAQAQCASSPGVGADNNGGSGGGGGGGYGGAGGTGGTGNNNPGPLAKGGVAGGAQPSTPAGIQGGCPGARGGRADGTAGGAGGAAGGAIYIAAKTSITLNGGVVINASGDGGKHGTVKEDGGGGGGSGGMIFLEAPQISGASAALAANGGSGGGGSDSATLGQDGMPGLISTAPATGGAKGGVGSSGGNGGAHDQQVGGNSGLAEGAGGGGGGGVGFIRVLSANQTIGTISPTPITH